MGAVTPPSPHLAVMPPRQEAEVGVYEGYNACHDWPARWR
jgi:hypothetical protein